MEECSAGAAMRMPLWLLLVFVLVVEASPKRVWDVAVGMVAVGNVPVHVGDRRRHAGDRIRDNIATFL